MQLLTKPTALRGEVRDQMELGRLAITVSASNPKAYLTKRPEFIAPYSDNNEISPAVTIFWVISTGCFEGLHYLL
jgi:hypothetical protein